MRRAALVILGTLAAASPAAAHPAPFSYVDVLLGERSVDVTVVAHVFDLAHDLEIDDPEDLLDPAVLAQRSGAVVALMTPRFEVASDGRVLSCRSSEAPSASPDQQSVRLRQAMQSRATSPSSTCATPRTTTRTSSRQEATPSRARSSS